MQIQYCVLPIDYNDDFHLVRISQQPVRHYLDPTRSGHRQLQPGSDSPAAAQAADTADYDYLMSPPSPMTLPTSIVLLMRQMALTASLMTPSPDWCARTMCSPCSPASVPPRHLVLYMYGSYPLPSTLQPAV